MNAWASLHHKARFTLFQQNFNLKYTKYELKFLCSMDLCFFQHNNRKLIKITVRLDELHIVSNNDKIQLRV